MDNNLFGILDNIDLKDASSFISTANSDVTIKRNEEKVTNDYTWLAIIEEKLPYIDAIIQNPRRFLMQEEEIIPVEKTKKVSRESIKHLSQHTSLIQSVEDDGSVYPEKLLNVYKEETYDLYENRFIATLINRLYDFIDGQMTATDESHEYKKRSVKYFGKTKVNKETVNIEVNLETSLYQKLDNIDIENIRKRKSEVSEVMEEFVNGEFMKIMKPAAPVKNPIRKTNTLLKNENFRHALELWEYLDKIEDDIPNKEEKINEEIKNQDIQNDFNLTYFMNYYSLISHLEGKEFKKIKQKDELDKLLKDYIYNNELEEKMLKKKFNDIIKKTNQSRSKVRKEIKAFYTKHLNFEIKRIKKAISYLK